MWRLDAMHEVTPAIIDEVVGLVATASSERQPVPLSEQLLVDLRAGGGPGFAAVSARAGGRLVGWAQLAAGNHARSVELLVEPDADLDDGHEGLRTQLLDAALGLVAGDGGGPVHWWSVGDKARDAQIAAAAGMAPGRRLAQMSRPLPTGMTVDVDTRPFRPGEDEGAWLAVNNRAFADHPEQGGWTIDTLRGREAEPWFDPDGFLLHERGGRLAAFCWTKLHDGSAAPQPIGEIYVIGVDPDFQGLGLGRQLTLAGLASIADRGVDLGMLYVDAANVAAVTLYNDLGFTTARLDVAHTVKLAPATPERN